MRGRSRSIPVSHMTQRRISARWLLLWTLNVLLAVRGTVYDAVDCGPDVMCEGKDPVNNPQYFKPTIGDLRRCYCDEECVKYGDCCVDKSPFPLHHNRTDNITTWSCVAKSYNETVYAVSDCIVKELWSSLCKKQQYIPQFEYLSDLPVFSNYTKLYYANVFCAFCDQRLWLKYGYWLGDYFTEPKLVTHCTPNITFDMFLADRQYVYGRLMWRVKDGYCGIFQQEEIELGRPCMPSVSSCSEGADLSLSDKCKAYSQLLSINDTVYRNPDCAICNGISQSDSFCKFVKPHTEFDELTRIFSLDWFLDSCQENMRVRDNFHPECKAVNCDLESGKCNINECDDTCHLTGDFIDYSGYLVYACLSASIICLMIHVYKAIFISPPTNLPSKVLNSLAWSMLVAQTLFLTSMYSLAKLPQHPTLCYITAVAIQYFFLASFFWMSVISFDIWFTFSNTFQLFSTSYKKYALYAWGGTGVIIIFLVIVDLTDCFPNAIRPRFGHHENACWVGTTYNGLIYYLAIPIGIVLFINTVFFIMIIRLFSKQRSCVIAISGRKEYSLLLFHVKISIVIGMSWVATLSIMAFIMKPEVHCALGILNGLQGVFIYITFDLKTDSVFGYVKHLLHRIFGIK